MVPKFYDGNIMMSISSIEGVNGFDYWLDIFTRPNHGPQYRPLSFYAVFNVIPRLFPFGTYIFHLLGIIFIAVAFLNLNKIMNKLEVPEKLKCLLGILFIIHPVFVSFLEITFVFKYGFPLFVLSYLLRTMTESSLKPVDLLSLMLLLTLAIISHEGSIVFFSIGWMFYFLLNRNFAPKLLVLAIPTIVYLIARIFYFGVPTEKFMAINFEQMPLNLMKGLAYTWLPSHEIAFELRLLLIAVFTSFFLWRKYFWEVSFAFLSTIAILSTFSLLGDHFFPERIVWEALIVPLFFAFIVKENRKIQNSNKFILLFLVFFFINYIQQKKSLFEYANKIESQMEYYTKDIRDYFNTLGFKSPVKFRAFFESEVDFIVRNQLVAYIARVWKDRTFVIEYSERDSYQQKCSYCYDRSIILFEKGAFYYFIDEKWVDRFDRVKPRQAKFDNLIDINIKIEEKYRLESFKGF